MCYFLTIDRTGIDSFYFLRVTRQGEEFGLGECAGFTILSNWLRSDFVNTRNQITVETTAIYPKPITNRRS